MTKVSVPNGGRTSMIADSPSPSSARSDVGLARLASEGTILLVLTGIVGK